ncbi:MAG: hypothetical protein HZT41_13010 [Dechloromonas sp.]|nr:MAG: hypothetical protein HZT41_13010 [Dechloromonas sp.]
MEALRLIAEPKNHQLIIDLPPSLDQRRLEVIIMPASGFESAATASAGRRKPSVLLAGTVSLRDDLVAPVIPESDWDALK